MAAEISEGESTRLWGRKRGWNIKGATEFLIRAAISWFSNWSRQQNHPGGLRKHRFLGSNPQIFNPVDLSGARESAFLTSSQEIPLLLWGIPCESHRCRMSGGEELVSQGNKLTGSLLDMYYLRTLWDMLYLRSSPDSCEPQGSKVLFCSHLYHQSLARCLEHTWHLTKIFLSE